MHLVVELLHGAEHALARRDELRLVGTERREDEHAHYLDGALRVRLRAHQLG